MFRDQALISTTYANYVQAGRFNIPNSLHLDTPSPDEDLDTAAAQRLQKISANMTQRAMARLEKSKGEGLLGVGLRGGDNHQHVVLCDCQERYDGPIKPIIPADTSD